MEFAVFPFESDSLKLTPQISKPKPLCDLCKTFDPTISHDDRLGIKDTRINVAASLVELAKSSRDTGCTGCALLHACLSHILGTTQNVEAEISYMMLGYEPWAQCAPHSPGSSLFGVSINITGVPGGFLFFSTSGK